MLTQSMPLLAERALVVGAAGSHLVCADLLIGGYSAFLIPHGAAYDVVCDVRGRLIRIQVKTTQRPRRYAQQRQSHITGYIWHVRCGKGALRAYGPDAFEVLALVALDTRRIAYVPRRGVRQTMQIPVEGARRLTVKHFEDYGFEAAIS